MRSTAPATPGTPPIQIPQLFPPKVTLPVPNTRKPVIDPSGVVYEGVKSNRIEGVTATIYEVDNDGNRTVWNAAEYDQVNPYTTDKNGFYQWMVPEGKWSVTFTKDGYAAYTTGADDGYGAALAGDTYYMPVAPAQLDVNINLQRSDPPEVESVKATPDGVYIVFNQYMDTETLTADRFFLLVKSQEVKPTITFVDGEKEGENTYAREIMLAYKIPADADVALTIQKEVKSYTEKTMNANYVQADVTVAALTQVVAPTFTPAANKVDVNKPVTISAPSGTKVYYTTDGSAPSRASTLYTGPVLITGDMTIKAIAVSPGMADSEVATASYTIDHAPTYQDATTNGGSAGGGAAGSVVNLPASTPGGTVAVSPTSAAKGTKVTITPTPDAGYRVDKVSVTDSKGNPVAVTDNGDGTYSFTMPAGAVDVDVTFTPLVPDDWRFVDVAEDAWYHDAVYHCYDSGYFKGTDENHFTPNGTMTRAMFATVLYRIAGEPPATGTNPFTDVATGQWYTDAIVWAAGQKVIEGYGSGKFGPNDPVTREQMVTIFWRYNDTPSAQSGDMSAFTDTDQISDWAKDAFAWAVSAGIINGKGNGVLDPKGTATRAEVAQIVMNYDAKAG